MLLYIEDRILLGKILTYLDYIKKDYTLDLEAEYEYVLVAQLNKKTDEIIKNKKVIFITYLIEDKLHNIFNKNNKKTREYRNLIINKFNNYFKIIVSLESIKIHLSNIIKTNIEVINKELPLINISNNKEIYSKYNIKRRKKNIMFIDFDYKHLEELYTLSKEYPKINFIYIGFKPNYDLTNKDKGLFNKLNNNIIKVRYYDLNIFTDLVKISDIVINTSNIILDINYLYLIFIFKKIFISIQDIYYDNYLINSKHIYIFENSKELYLKLNKIINERLQNLTEEAYDVVKDNDFFNISKKYSIYLD